jgi:ABC-type methionine transport system ATPase subunit
MAGSAQRKVFLTFPQRLVKEPIIYNLGKSFQIVTNIRGASVTDEIALIALLLEGEEKELDRAIEYLEKSGVKVESIEED